SVPIDIRTVHCTDCHEPMLDGDIESNPLICRDCHARSSKIIGDCSPEKVFVDYHPLGDKLIQGVILHLNRLAESSKPPLDKRKRALASARDQCYAIGVIVDPLWDQELDSEGHDFT